MCIRDRLPEDRHVLVASHGAALNALYLQIKGLPLSLFWTHRLDVYKRQPVLLRHIGDLLQPAGRHVVGLQRKYAYTGIYSLEPFRQVQ